MKSIEFARMKTAPEQTPEPQKGNHIFSNVPPAGSKCEPLIGVLNQNGGSYPFGEPLVWENGRYKGFLQPINLLVMLEIASDPLHKENQWSCLVEKVTIYGTVYLRLVPSIPQSVKEQWDREKKAPKVTTSWEPIIKNEQALVLPVRDTTFDHVRRLVQKRPPQRPKNIAQG